MGLYKKLGVMLVVMVLVCSFLIACSSYSEYEMEEKQYVDLSKMSPSEEKRVGKLAMDYVEKTYHKAFRVDEVWKDEIFGAYYQIKGAVQDGTKITVIYDPPGEFRDDYVQTIWLNQVQPDIQKLLEKNVSLRSIDTEKIDYDDLEGNIGQKYGKDIPSFYHVLSSKKGEHFTLNLVLEVYQHGGKAPEDISNLLRELKKTFHNASIQVFVYTDELKHYPEITSDSERQYKYLLERYDISGDLTKVDLNNLDHYKVRYVQPTNRYY
ncbi:hypothetical protein [Thermoactinomyces sp. CICC 10523]|uniref:hypothetical protein n=1 Tax=Thermoactinomyces sp. CICC 10523 TaxID=2767428 RepID=UPI0018DDD288|nr:hypothetical protein [Thermoactinomyces sp. CICC 10523]MBH8598428.1 hypothetical protein [Thermoactinomyces sp. CICC 10523]